MLEGKKIVLGITGSIAAYKACHIIRLLVKKGAEVQVVITPAGREFITPITLSALTQKPVISEFFAQADGSWHSHVDIGLWADAMLVAPATAATIGKMAHGIADNMLVTTYLSMKAPVFIAPAMDLDMYAHPSTQDNLNELQKRGDLIIEPTEGELASKLVGKGRMNEPEEIVARLEQFFAQEQRLAGKRVMITAGPTYERIDPVRFIGNFSSGKMGMALAEAAANMGAEVYLIAGPMACQSAHTGIRTVDVVSADEMLQAAEKIFPKTDAAIMCAAVADYKPEKEERHKIKRGEEKHEMLLRFVPNPDIAATLGRQKRNDQLLAGFALETENGVAHAKDKLKKKGFDFIVLNSMSDPGAGFGVDTNKVSIISADKVENMPLKTKKELGRDLMEYVASLLEKKKQGGELC